MAAVDETQVPTFIEQSVTDRLCVSEGINVVKADDTGKVFEEQSVRDDARKTTGCRVDLSGPLPCLLVSGLRKARLNNLADENESATALAEALSKEKHRTILVEPKLMEDSKFPDIWLRDTKSGVRMGVQITNFDDTAIRNLGSDGAFELNITIAAIADAICKGIAKKNQIDSGLAAKTYLLLISPYPLPAVVHPFICAEVVARSPEKKYLETWVASRREPAFCVQG